VQRHVSAFLELDVTSPARLVCALAVAGAAREELTVASDGSPVPWREVPAPHGGRLHVLDAPTGRLVLQYTATVDGRLPVPDAGDVDRITALRPSRYCPADKLLAVAAAEFGGIDDRGELVSAVREWVHGRLSYVGGASGPTDDAVDTLLLGQGVCRDYAHLVIALLRAQDVPARLAAVYAPGLDPMDFHAVVEAWVDGTWRLVDATGLAPRASMLRIATGADAADTAFLSIHDGTADLLAVQVTAVVDDLPGEDPAEVVPLT
jgi:transglutaminase-like putative cysteine protease